MFFEWFQFKFEKSSDAASCIMTYMYHNDQGFSKIDNAWIVQDVTSHV